MLHAWAVTSAASAFSSVRQVSQAACAYVFSTEQGNQVYFSLQSLALIQPAEQDLNSACVSWPHVSFMRGPSAIAPPLPDIVGGAIGSEVTVNVKVSHAYSLSVFVKRDFINVGDVFNVHLL